MLYLNAPIKRQNLINLLIYNYGSIEYFKEREIVRFLPEYEEGNDEFYYVLLADPDGINTGLPYPSTQDVNIEWIVKVSTS